MKTPRLRSAAALAVATGLLLTLSACGSKSVTEIEDAASDNGLGAGPEAGALPVTIEHKFGTTEITEAPQRVVAVGLVEQDALLALGIAPVGTTYWYGEEDTIGPWAEEALGDSPAPEVLKTEREFEQVRLLQPDLIIGIYSGMTKQDYQTLSKIAPVVAAPAGFVDYGVPWQETTELIGRAVGRPAAAAALVEDVTGQIEDAAAAHPEFAGLQAAWVSLYEGIYVYGPQDPRVRLLTELGFEFPAELGDIGGESFGGSISVENAARVDLDAVVWFGAEDDGLYVSTSFQTPLGIPFLLERLVPQLAAAVDGDPATT